MRDNKPLANMTTIRNYQGEIKRSKNKYTLYKKFFRKKPGHPYSQAVFIVADLISFIKEARLIQKGKRYKAGLKWAGEEVWYFEAKEVDDEPFRQDLRKIIEKNYPHLKKHLSRYVKTAQSEKFSGSREMHTFGLKGIVGDWDYWKRIPKKTQRTVERMGKDIDQAKRIESFICACPEQRALRRDIRRKFGTGTKDLDRIGVLLNVLGIFWKPIEPKRIRGKNRKRILYYRKNPSQNR
jgi:hypothetical protein